MGVRDPPEPPCTRSAPLPGGAVALRPMDARCEVVRSAGVRRCIHPSDARRPSEGAKTGILFEARA